MKPIKIILLLAVAAFFGCANSPNRASKNTNVNLSGVEGQPNIVFLYFDDMGYGDVSCLNPDSKIHTPNIDKFPASGMTFTDAHAPAAICTPSRYGILTGRYPWRSRLKYGVMGAFSPPLIEKKTLTIAEMLKKKGYTTGHVGKWHLGKAYQLENPAESYEQAYAKIYAEKGKFGDPGVDFTKPIVDGPNQHGFDYSATRFITLVENGIPQGRVEVKKRHSKKGYSSPDFPYVEQVPTWVKKADVFIQSEAKKDKPFFLYYALTAPHMPHVPTKEFLGKSGIGLYGDFMLECDWVVAELMKSLEKAGVDKNTLVIFSSDNGPENITLTLKEKVGHYSAGPFRGHKRLNYEGGHREPTFAVWPGVIQPGSVCDKPISQVDFFATCAEIVGYKLKPDEAVDSWSFLPALKGDTSWERGEAIVHQNYQGNLAVRKGDWVMMMHPEWRGMTAGYSDPDETGEPDITPYQLFKLSDDINQRKNLVEKYPEKAAEMKALCKKLVINGRSTPGPKQENDPPFAFDKAWTQLDWTKQ